MKISIDIDGVLADFGAQFYEELRVVSNRISSCYPPRFWNWHDLGATDLDVSNAWNRIRQIENWYEGLNALPGIVDLRHALYVGLFNNHDLIFTTSRVNTKGYSSQEQTRHWLEEKLGLYHPDVFVVPHQISKPDLLRTLGAHAHLDDFPPTVQVAKYHCQAYLLQQPWNEHDIAAYSIRSVSSVGRFLEALGLG